MDLKKIIGSYELCEILGESDINITGIEHDSRKIKKGNMFIALKGYTVNGHDYILKAIENGAIALVVEEEVEKQPGITYIKVKDTLDALANFSTNYYESPWKKLKTIGITGTNGKTSTTYFIKSIMDENNLKTGILGTIGAVIDEKLHKLDNTTPDSLTIQENLHKMVEADSKVCVMEVSSHSLDLKRVEYMDFNIGIFTNLTKDHLDYHKTIDKYFNSKLKLFFKTKDFNIVNIDDHYGKEIIKFVGSEVPLITYGIKEKADIMATDIVYSIDKVKFNLNLKDEKLPVVINVPGEFSVYNALAAAATAYSLGIHSKFIVKGLEEVKGIKGRFEVVPTNKDFSVIIDFAHTADGLEKVLTVIDQFAEGRKVVVFGAGGNRDRTKRPEMGETVGKHADFAIVTSDNPRHEDPEKIIEDVVEGVKLTDCKFVAITDRKEAIKYAIENAMPKDIILLAGKGHEAYTIIGDKTYPFDERQIVLDIINDKK